MSQQPAAGRRTTRRYRGDIGPGWWVALLVVCLALGFVGRSSGGFWSPFLWSVVGFVVGSLVALAVASARVPPRPADTTGPRSRDRRSSR